MPGTRSMRWRPSSAATAASSWLRFWAKRSSAPPLLAASPTVATLDVTGGAPELNPHFRRLVAEARRLGRAVIDRCNLTILFEPGQEDLAAFLAAWAVGQYRAMHEAAYLATSLASLVAAGGLAVYAVAFQRKTRNM